MGVVADILGCYGTAYLETAGPTASPAQWRAVHRITGCRTGLLGGHTDVCADCGDRGEFVPHSCRDRLCPVCRGPEAASWLDARRSELLAVPYFHVIVTVPPPYGRAVRDQPARLGGELMGAVAESLQAVAGDSRYGGGKLGMLMVLHTWGRNLSWHAHVHCVIPGVLLHADGSYTVLGRGFLLPLAAVKKVFRAVLTRRFRARIPGFDPPGRVWRQVWNAKVRACLEGPETVLKYLTRYVRSGPLNEAQIVRADHEQVAFRYLDHRTGTVRLWHAAPGTFLGRYLQHALPDRFHRIRYFGFLAPSRRADLRVLQTAMVARTGASALVPASKSLLRPPPPPCPRCGSIRPRIRVHFCAGSLSCILAKPSRAPPRGVA